jgi:hypothetical protein
MRLLSLVWLELIRSYEKHYLYTTLKLTKIYQIFNILIFLTKQQSAAKKNEITIKTTSLNEMTDLLRKVSYVSKETYPKPGTRSIKLSSTLK